MIIVMNGNAGEDDISGVTAFIRSRGLQEHVSRGAERTIIGAVGDERIFDPRELEALKGVEKAIRIVHDWRIISREAQQEGTQISVRGVVFGGEQTVEISVLPDDTVGAVRKAPGDVLFVDPFAPPETPYAPRGAPDAERLRRLEAQIRTATEQNRPVMVRLRDIRRLDEILQADADMLYLEGSAAADPVVQEEVGRLNIPAVLCKEVWHSAEAWLTAAEHTALYGNHHLIFCEAGTLGRNNGKPYRLDTDAIAKVRKISRLPVIADISRLAHPFMDKETLRALALAAGAGGIVS